MFPLEFGRTWAPLILLGLTSAGTGLGAQPAAPATNPDTPIRAIGEVRRLHPEEAILGRETTLTGVVTFCTADRRELFLQDDTGGLRVTFGAPAASAAIGRRAEIEGLTTYEAGAVTVVGRRLRDRGPGRLPAAQPVLIDELYQGGAHGRRVEVEGVVHRVSFEGGDTTIALGFGRDPLLLRVQLAPPADIMGLVDARVRVHGIAVNLANPQGQATNPLLLVPDFASIAVLRPAPAEPFTIPAAPVRFFQAFSDEANGHRVRVEGVVTRYRPARGLYLEHDGAALYAETDMTAPLRPGDRVEVLGFASADRYAPRLENTVFRRIAEGPGLEPLRTTAADVIAEAYEARLVRVRGRVLEIQAGPTERMLTLDDDGRTFRATLEGGPGTPVPAGVGRNGVVDLTGVVYLRDLDSNRVPRSFDLLLRSAEDLAVVVPAPWWTAERLNQALILSLLFALGLFVWALVLGGQARRREDQAKQQVALARSLDERYRDLFDRMSEMAYVHDKVGRLQALNPAGERLTGYSNAEATAMHAVDLVAPPYAAVMSQIMRLGPRPDVARSHEVKILTRDGRQIPVSLSVHRLFERGEYVGMQGICRTMPPDEVP